MKLIDYTMNSWPQRDADDAAFVVESMISIVEKGLATNRTTFYEGFGVGAEDISFASDADAGECQGFVFAIIEADDDETLDQATKVAREVLRDKLRACFGKTERQLTLF
jgi:hypothetical protein